VPGLIEALRDETLYVRICAAGALGSIGPGARAALEPLREAGRDPALRAEAGWAAERIAGVPGGSANPAGEMGPVVVQMTGPSGENLAPAAPPPANPPLDWDVNTGRNIAWRVELGGDTFGRPVVAGGVVYVGTDNAGKRDPRIVDECGVLMALGASDGAFLWQDAAPRVKRGLREFLLPSTTSAPYVEGERLYYLTAECQLRCLDVQRAGQVVWELDLCGALGVFPHEACNSEVLPLGDLLVVCTSNGQNEGHTRVPSPRAPSLIAVDKRSGKVVWQAVGAGGNVLHGQWCSPTAARVNGRMQVLFGGGDGWLRAYDGESGREVWRFDGNPKDAVWRPRPGVFSRCSIVASPVYDGEGRVFLAMGEDPSHGNGPSLLHAISPKGQGDVTESRRLWTCRQIGRVVATPVLGDGLLYVADVGGTVYCVDAVTGDVLWKHGTQGDIWGCLFLVGQRLYAGNVDGTMTVLRAGRQKGVLGTVEMEEPLYSRGAVVGDAIYLATGRGLYLIR
jgi:outer membrane protein assembly factor BamB